MGRWLEPAHFLLSTSDKPGASFVNSHVGWSRRCLWTSMAIGAAAFVFAAVYPAHVPLLRAWFAQRWSLPAEWFDPVIVELALLHATTVCTLWATLLADEWRAYLPHVAEPLDPSLWVAAARKTPLMAVLGPWVVPIATAAAVAVASRSVFWFVVEALYAYPLLAWGRRTWACRLVVVVGEDREGQVSLLQRLSGAAFAAIGALTVFWPPFLLLDASGLTRGVAWALGRWTLYAAAAVLFFGFVGYPGLARLERRPGWVRTPAHLRVVRFWKYVLPGLGGGDPT
jgi:hypothetical protein